MRRPLVIVLTVAASWCLGGAALAQTSNSPNFNDVAQQFKTGANRVGGGAVQMGEGVRQAAIVLWEAVKDGAATTAARLNGDVQPARQSQ
jgi:hypothetical protein